MSKTVEFYFDFGSPSAYLAHTQMAGLAERTGADIVYRPISLGAVFKMTGNTSPGTVPQKAAYLRAHDLPRYIRRYGIPFSLPPGFPVNTKDLMRGAVVAAEDGDPSTYIDTVFRAMWADSQDMVDPAVMAKVLSAAGLDARHIAGRIGDAAIKQSFIAMTEAALARGIFGAPTFFVGDEMFFGQDRLDFVEEAAGA